MTEHLASLRVSAEEVLKAFYRADGDYHAATANAAGDEFSTYVARGVALEAFVTTSTNYYHQAREALQALEPAYEEVCYKITNGDDDARDTIVRAYYDARKAKHIAQNFYSQALYVANTDAVKIQRARQRFLAAIGDPAALEAARADASFDQAFNELANFHGFGSVADNEVKRIEAVTFALDKLPQLTPHRVYDALQKSAALAALAAAAAAELQAAAESHEVALWPDLDLSLAVTARADLQVALSALNELLDQGRP
jgi:hypothetical protein